MPDVSGNMHEVPDVYLETLVTDYLKAVTCHVVLYSVSVGVVAIRTSRPP